MRKWSILFFLATITASGASAAAAQRDLAWGAAFFQLPLSAEISVIGDAQLRSDDNANGLAQRIIRAGLHHAVDRRHGVSAGYAAISTFDTPTGDVLEHRFWQQYLYNQSAFGHNLSHRLRLEQRFLEGAQSGRDYTQRLRYANRLVLPIASTSAYGLAQNELFLNIENRGRANGALFDQNRALLGVGRKVWPDVDVELGYVQQYVQRRGEDLDNRIVQLALHWRP